MSPSDFESKHPRKTDGKWKQADHPENEMDLDDSATSPPASATGNSASAREVLRSMGIDVDALRRQLSAISQREPDQPALPESNKRLRGHNFYPPKTLRQKIPGLYATEDIPVKDKTMFLHYFTGRADWYIAEVDWDSGQAFGHCDLGLGSPEWGYVDLKELEQVQGKGLSRVVERDLYFEPTRFADLDIN